MSDRLATRAYDIIEQLDEMRQNVESQEQLDRIDTVHDLLKKIAAKDRDKHGATPEDKLVHAIENTDKCLNCGEPIEQGGWCGLSCLQEMDS